MVTNYASEIVRAASARGTPNARRSSPRSTGAEAARGRRHAVARRPHEAVIAQVDLVRIDEPAGGDPRGTRAAAAARRARRRRARAGGAGRPRDHRRLRAPGGHLLGGVPARACRSRQRVRRAPEGQPREEPFAVLPVSGSPATPRSAATRPRRCAGTARPTTRAKGRRPGCSGARATSPRWSSSRRRTKAIEAATAKLWSEAAAQPDAFYMRSARYLQKVGEKLQAWNKGDASRGDDAPASQARRPVRGAGASADERATCRSLLGAPAKPAA